MMILSKSNLKLFLLFFMFFILGCSPVIILNTSAPSNLNQNLGGGKKIALYVGDFRENTKIFQTSTKKRGQMFGTPIDHMWYIYKSAFSACGFNIATPAELSFIVEIKEFFVSWPDGHNVNVTGNIKLNIKIITNKGLCLIEKEFSHQETEKAIGGGAVGNLPEEVLQKSLNKIVVSSLMDDEILKAMNKKLAN